MIRLKVWGRRAAFNYPGMVERTTYPIMTPSAAAGLLRSIFGKKEFEWSIASITVLNRGYVTGIKRNELKFSGGSGDKKDIERDRTQRRMSILNDVAYIIEAEMRFLPGHEPDAAKDYAQFRRRVRRGQFFEIPCLGCREFPARFSEPDGTELAESEWTEDLGRMLLHIDFRSREDPKRRFFNAVVDRGVMKIPEWRAPC